MGIGEEDGGRKEGRGKRGGQRRNRRGEDNEGRRELPGGRERRGGGGGEGRCFDCDNDPNIFFGDKQTTQPPRGKTNLAMKSPEPCNSTADASGRPTRASRKQGRRRPDKGQRSDSPEAAPQPASHHGCDAATSDTNLGQRASPMQRINSKRRACLRPRKHSSVCRARKRSIPKGDQAPKQRGQADGPRKSSKGHVGQPICETQRSAGFIDRRERGDGTRGSLLWRRQSKAI